MEVYHASEHCFDEFSSDPSHKEVGHHFSPHRDLCLSLVDTEQNHHVYQVEIPDGPYWEMFDVVDWNKADDFVDSFRRSCDLGNDHREFEKIWDAAGKEAGNQGKQSAILSVLEELGYAGISYHNEHERGIGGAESYMVFSEENIELLDREDVRGEMEVDI